MERRPAPAWAKGLLTLALVLAIAPAVVILVGAVGTKLGWWGWKTGFVAVMVNGPAPGVGWAPGLAMLAIAVSLIGVIVSIWVGSWRRSLAALLISLATMGAFIFIGGQARKAPPIHDVSTNWTEPLMFSDAVMKRRGAESNPVEANPMAQAPGLAGKRIAEVNEQTCPQARPVLLKMSADDAYARAKAALTDNGLEIVTDDPATGRLEAVATSFWYGFKDDLVARVAPEGSGARVDMRSVSRVGMSDLGQNCKRIAAVAAGIRDQASR
jgi:fatty-acyl-CoA synthase